MMTNFSVHLGDLPPVEIQPVAECHPSSDGGHWIVLRPTNAIDVTFFGPLDRLESIVDAAKAAITLARQKPVAEALDAREAGWTMPASPELRAAAAFHEAVDNLPNGIDDLPVPFAPPFGPMDEPTPIVRPNPEAVQAKFEQFEANVRREQMITGEHGKAFEPTPNVRDKDGFLKSYHDFMNSDEAKAEARRFKENLDASIQHEEHERDEKGHAAD